MKYNYYVTFDFYPGKPLTSGSSEVELSYELDTRKKILDLRDRLKKVFDAEILIITNFILLKE